MRALPAEADQPLLASPPDQTSRRSTLLTALQAAAAVALAPPLRAALAAPAVLTVGLGQQFETIGDALASAPDGGTVEVYSGRWALQGDAA